MKLILIIQALIFIQYITCQKSHKIRRNKLRRRSKGEEDKSSIFNPMKYIYPIDLPDQNQDGQADNIDFQKAFSGYKMTRYDISQLFEVADINRNGKVNQDEWSKFYTLFVQPFESADTAEPRDGVLETSEVEKSLEEFSVISKIIKDSEDKEYLSKILETLNARTKDTQDKLAINLNEYIFLRRSAVAFEQCCTGEFITKSQIQSCSQTIMLPNIPFSENQQNTFYDILRKYSRQNDKIGDHYRFLSFLSIFHKYDMFQRLRQNKMNSGTLNYKEISQASMDAQGPSQKLNQAVIEVVFKKERQNLEFTGLDFRQFFILMQSIDFCYIYGKQNSGNLNFEEFNQVLDDGVFDSQIVQNVDDCYLDKKEEDEYPEKKSHEEEKQIFSQVRRRRNHRLQKKRSRKFQQFEKVQFGLSDIDKNKQIRQSIFNIFDLSNDNESIQGGELFNFHKFSIMFLQLVKGNVHLIYQKNLDFDSSVQKSELEISIFKEELYIFKKLQRWLREQQKFHEIGLNFLQFAGYQYYKEHFMINGQQSLVSNKVPFPAFRKVQLILFQTIQDIGFQIHRDDFLGDISYPFDSPAKIHAQKYDIDVYLKDGALVDFENAFHKILLRYSKTMMKTKFFNIQRKI